jgi:hypothetical protein
MRVDATDDGPFARGFDVATDGNRSPLPERSTVRASDVSLLVTPSAITAPTPPATNHASAAIVTIFVTAFGTRRSSYPSESRLVPGPQRAVRDGTIRGDDSSDTIRNGTIGNRTIHGDDSSDTRCTIRPAAVAEAVLLIVRPALRAGGRWRQYRSLLFDIHRIRPRLLGIHHIRRRLLGSDDICLRRFRRGRGLWRWNEAHDDCRTNGGGNDSEQFGVHATTPLAEREFSGDLLRTATPARDADDSSAAPRPWCRRGYANTDRSHRR